MEKVLSIIGAATVLFTSLAGLVAAANYFINRSSLLASSIWEIKKYGLKRRRKDGSSPLVD